MNEQLKKLAFKAGFVGEGMNPIVGTCQETALENFAELLLREGSIGFSTGAKKRLLESFGFEYHIKWSKNDKDDYILTIEEWDEAVETHCIMDFDGHGYWSKEDAHSDLMVFEVDQPDWATHVVWYNK